MTTEHQFELCAGDACCWAGEDALTSPCFQRLCVKARNGVILPCSVAGMQMESIILQGFGERPWASWQIARCKVCWQLAKRRRNYSERAGISFAFVLKGVERTGFGEILQSPSQSLLLGHLRRGIFKFIPNSGQNILHYNTPYS